MESQLSTFFSGLAWVLVVASLGWWLIASATMNILTTKGSAPWPFQLALKLFLQPHNFPANKKQLIGFCASVGVLIYGCEMVNGPEWFVILGLSLFYLWARNMTEEAALDLLKNEFRSMQNAFLTGQCRDQVSLRHKMDRVASLQFLFGFDQVD